MIHIVFNEPDIEVLKKAFELDASLEGEVRLVRDDYAVGPLADIYETEGYQQRREWWRQLLEQSPYDPVQLMDMVDDRLAVHQLKQALDENSEETVWIWMGQNQHDVCGYYWLMSQLSTYSGKIFVLYLNNLPFINEKGQIFYPAYLSQILPSEFLKARKLNRKITPSEFEVDPDEWKKICSENAMVRSLEGGKKIVSREDEFYDKDILAVLTKDWMKGNKALHQILGKMKIKTGDVFLVWRINQLAEAGKIQINGTTAGNFKDFELRLASKEEVAQEQSES